ncbi:MAG: hypothetical protein FJ148_15285 [Deltaproteobacteria bacterium]|nr:hypothetical protein [Deltaproteobacteria bacterium]
MSPKESRFGRLHPARCALRIASLAGVIAGACFPGVREAQAAPPETMPIFRAQLTVRTCDVTNAQTNDPVFASLNGSNSTALDYGRNDFERNDTFTYDLVRNGVATVSDVTRLRISKTGSNGLSICRLDLRLNGALIFTQTFPATGAGRLFLDGSGASRARTITGATLRASQTWATYTPPFPPFVLARAEMESRIEALAGTRISGQIVRWGQRKGPRFVEATRDDANTLHLDLDLEEDTRNAIASRPFLSGVSSAIGFIERFTPVPLPNPAVDVDFDVTITCDDGMLDFAVGGASVDVDTFPRIDLPSLPVPGLREAVDFVETKLNQLVDVAEDLVEALLGVPAIEAGLAAGLTRISFGTATPIRPNVTVQNNGDVTFSL